jgi:hypothetical protein
MCSRGPDGFLYVLTPKTTARSCALNHGPRGRRPVSLLFLLGTRFGSRRNKVLDSKVDHHASINLVIVGVI